MNALPKNTRRAFLIAAALIFAGAMVWLAVLESHSYTRALCTKLGEFGYRVSPSDLYSRGYGKNTSIASVAEEDLSKACELSRMSGFGSDIDRIGLVELMLYNVDGEKVMYIWLVDREPELVFIEDLKTGELLPIGS